MSVIVGNSSTRSSTTVQIGNSSTRATSDILAGNTLSVRNGVGGQGLLSGAGNVTSNINQGTGTIITLATPSNTVVGDLLLFYVYTGYNTRSPTWTGPTGGWTQLTTLSNNFGSNAGRVYAKIAAAGDLGSTVTASVNIGSRIGGILIRGVGYDSTVLTPNVVGVEYYTSANLASPQTTNSITTTKSTTIISIGAFNVPGATSTPVYSSANANIVATVGDTSVGAVTKLGIAQAQDTTPGSFIDAWSWQDGTTSRGSVVLIALPNPVLIRTDSATANFTLNTSSTNGSVRTYAATSALFESLSFSIASLRAFTNTVSLAISTSRLGTSLRIYTANASLIAYANGQNFSLRNATSYVPLVINITPTFASSRTVARTALLAASTNRLSQTSRFTNKVAGIMAATAKQSYTLRASSKLASLVASASPASTSVIRLGNANANLTSTIVLNSSTLRNFALMTIPARLAINSVANSLRTDTGNAQNSVIFNFTYKTIKIGMASGDLYATADVIYHRATINRNLNLYVKINPNKSFKFKLTNSPDYSFRIAPEKYKIKVLK